MSVAAFCFAEQKPCVKWVAKYFGDCLCDGKDWVSFGFGIISLVCWGVAEIPQIVTNFRTKSGHGVSLAFLLTWVVGDIFNMVGCLLDPATLPTQFYTAELYTASTIVLVLQGIYYDHIYKSKSKSKNPNLQIENDQEAEDDKKPLSSKPGIPIPTAESARRFSSRTEYYYTSARSMAGSGTPPFRSQRGVVKSGPSVIQLPSDSSSDDESPRTSTASPTHPRKIPRNSVLYGTFVSASVNIPFLAKGFSEPSIGTAKLKEGGGFSNAALGEILGWLMAVIYMGGRIPQIWLNIKRGSVEGLNPLMFFFALVANLAYVLSIVVRTTEWEKIQSNLPWLLDAAVCVFMDFFILLQYAYYKHLRRNEESDEEKTKNGCR